MVLSIIFLEDKHTNLLHISILYEYQQFIQHRICFSIQPQLQLVNLHKNRRYFVIKLHTWLIFYEYQQFFQHRICFSIQPPDYSDPWPRLACSSSLFLIMLFNDDRLDITFYWKWKYNYIIVLEILLIYLWYCYYLCSIVLCIYMFLSE